MVLGLFKKKVDLNNIESLNKNWDLLKYKFPNLWLELVKESNGVIHTVKIKAKNLDKYMTLGWRIKKVLTKPPD